MAPTNITPPTKKQTGRPNPTKGTRLRSEPLTVEEIRKLLRACSRRSSTGLRAKALIALAWRSGLRVSECLHLYPADVDLERGLIHVLHAKGGTRKRRTVGLGLG